jgi:hypothetical protein
VFFWLFFGDVWRCSEKIWWYGVGFYGFIVGLIVKKKCGWKLEDLEGIVGCCQVWLLFLAGFKCWIL